MTDTPDSTPPFPGFPGFPPAEMLERMWGMMRLSPFGSTSSGAQPAGGFRPSLSMMSDMMAPLTNVEELDKRITDMRAVEQWLKLNLSMLQSAIQALEVQRATLATLRAFGAFAQQSMAQPASAAAAPGSSPAAGWPHMPAAASASADSSAESVSDEDHKDTDTTPPFDASAWWNLLQSQFNQIAQFAITQPAVAVAAAGGRAPEGAHEAASSVTGDAAESASKARPSSPEAASAARKPAAKRAPASAKRASSASASPRAGKKSV